MDELNNFIMIVIAGKFGITVMLPVVIPRIFKQSITVKIVTISDIFMLFRYFYGFFKLLGVAIMT